MDIVKIDLRKDNAIITVQMSTGIEVINLQEALSYTHDIDGNLERHAGFEATWEFQAIQKAEEIGLFFEQTYEAYMTHLRTYARYAARGMGEKSEKVTIEMTKDYLIRIYSERTASEERDRLAQASFKGFTIERLGATRVAESYITMMTPEQYRSNLATFYGEMFAWQDGTNGKTPFWYEAMVALRLKKQREKEEFQVLARTFRTRGYLLRQGAENAKARAMNIGGVTIDDIVDKAVARLRRITAGNSENSELPGTDPRLAPR